MPKRGRGLWSCQQEVLHPESQEKSEVSQNTSSESRLPSAIDRYYLCSQRATPRHSKNWPRARAREKASILLSSLEGLLPDLAFAAAALPQYLCSFASVYPSLLLLSGVASIVLFGL